MGGIEKNKRRVEKAGRREGILESRNEFVKIPIISLSHAHAYTHVSQEFLCFCCHKCHTIIYKTLYHRVLPVVFGAF